MVGPFRAAASAAAVVGLSVLCASSATADTWLNESNLPLECDACNIQFPAAMIANAGQSTDPFYGQIFEAGVTDFSPLPPNVLAQLGFGPGGSNPTTQGGWQWVATSFNGYYGLNGTSAEYTATLVPAFAGQYSYAFRFSLDGGQTFTACDLDGAGAIGGLSFDPAQLGVLTVVPEPSADAQMLSGVVVVALLAAKLRRRPRNAGGCA